MLGYQLSVFGFRLSVIGFRLSVIGYRFSVIGYRLSVVGREPSFAKATEGKSARPVKVLSAPRYGRFFLVNDLAFVNKSVGPVRQVRLVGRPPTALAVGRVRPVGRLFHHSHRLYAVKPRVFQWPQSSYLSYRTSFFRRSPAIASATAPFHLSSLIIRRLRRRNCTNTQLLLI